MKYKKFQHNQKSEGLPQGPNYRQTNEFISTYGYSDFSPFRNQEYLDIYSPNGVIDMSNTGIPLLANGGRYLPPYSGLHQFDTPWIREEKFEQGGAYLPKADVGLETPPTTRRKNYSDMGWFSEDQGWDKRARKRYGERPYLTGDEWAPDWGKKGKVRISTEGGFGASVLSKLPEDFDVTAAPKNMRDAYNMSIAAGASSDAEARVMAAQWALESSQGKSKSATEHYNYFGIKGDDFQMSTNEVRDGKHTTEDAGWAGYDSPLSGFKARVNFTNKAKGRYVSKGYGKDKSDLELANILSEAGYATSPTYAANLKRAMAKLDYNADPVAYELYQDIAVNSDQPTTEGASDQVVTEGSTKKPADSRGYTDEQRDEYLKLLQSDGANTQQQRQPIATNIPMIPMNQNMQPRFSNVTADMIKNRRGPLGGRKFKAKNISISQKGGPTYDFTKTPQENETLKKAAPKQAGVSNMLTDLSSRQNTNYYPVNNSNNIVAPQNNLQFNANTGKVMSAEEMTTAANDWSKLNTPEDLDWNEIGHSTLDAAGMIPLVGNVADLANAAWYAGEGDAIGASFSLASALPVVGYASNIAKATIKNNPHAKSAFLGSAQKLTNNQLAQREAGADYLDNSYKNSKLYNMGGNIQNQSIDSITSQNADRFKNYLLDTSNQYKMNKMQKLIQESGVSPEMMMNPQGYMQVGGNWLDAYNRGMANQQNLFTSGINDIVGNVGLVDSDKVKVGRKKGLDKTLGTKWFEFGEKGRRNRAAKDSFGMAAQNLGYLNEGYNNRDIKKLGMKNFMDVSRQMAAGRDDQGNIISPDMYAGAYGQSYDFPMAYGGVPPMMNYGGDYYDYRNGGAYLPMHQVAPGESRQLTQEELDELESMKYSTQMMNYGARAMFNAGESANSALTKGNRLVNIDKRIAENKEKNRKWRNNQAGNYRSVADQFDIWSNMKAGEASDAINEYFGWDGAGNSGFTNYAEDLDQYYKWLENKKGPYDVDYPMGTSPTVSSMQVGDPEAQALLDKKNAAEASKYSNTFISETKQEAALRKTLKQLAEMEELSNKAKADADAQKEKDEETKKETKKETDKGADEVAVNPNVAPTSPGGWQYSPFFNAGKIVNRRGPFGGYRNKMKDVSFGYTPFYAGSQGGMAAPQSDLDPRLQDYYMNNANRVVNPGQSVDPRDPRSGGFGNRLREGVANVAGGIRDKFADRRADRQDRRGQLINEYLNYDPTAFTHPDLGIEVPRRHSERTNQDIRDNIQQQRRLNKGERMYEADRKRAARDEERDLIDDIAYKGIRSGKKEAGKRDRLLKREARLKRRGSKAYGGEQYYGAGGPFGHIPMQDYGMGGGLRKYQGTTFGSEVDDDFGWNDNDTLGWNDSVDKSLSTSDPHNATYSNFKFKPNAGSAFQQVLKGYPNLSPSDTLYTEGDPRETYAFTYSTPATDALMDAAEMTYGDVDMHSIWDDQEEKEARINYDFTKTPQENRALLNNRYGGLRKFQNTGESREDELYNNFMNEQKRVAELTNPERLKRLMDESVGTNPVEDYQTGKYNKMVARGDYGCAATGTCLGSNIFGFTDREGNPIDTTSGTASFANPKHYEQQGYELLPEGAELQPGDVWNKATNKGRGVQGHYQTIYDPNSFMNQVVHNPGNIESGLQFGFHMQGPGSGRDKTKAYRYTGFQDEMQDELMDYVHDRPLERISTNPVNTLANNIDRRPMETYGTRSTDNLAALKLGQEIYLDGGQVEEMIKKGYKIQYF